jgi:predicted metalloprotease
MKWQGRRASRNIEDRRGRRTARAGGVRTGGIGGLGLVAVLVIGWALGVDVTPLLRQDGATVGQSSRPVTAQDRAEGQFVAVVLADTEDVWSRIFRAQVDATYPAPTLVLYNGITQSPCGGASGATGPFYCPGDRKIYLDTAFFATLSDRLGARGDFAAAYVVAHEVAHHVQNSLGILEQANRIRARSKAAQANAVSVRIELQADCYAGIWARNVQTQSGVVEPGDLEEAVTAARQIGDDTLQRNAGRVPMPHTFTHGTAVQRATWFQRGYDSGKLETCDTFAAGRL